MLSMLVEPLLELLCYGHLQVRTVALPLGHWAFPFLQLAAASILAKPFGNEIPMPMTSVANSSQVLLFLVKLLIP